MPVAAGQFGFGLMTTYFTDYDVAITPAADRVDQLNTIYNPLEFKARADLTLAPGRLSGRDVRELSRRVRQQPRESRGVGRFEDHARSESVVHLQRSGFADGLTIGVDVLNLLDEEPPFVNIAQSPNGGGGFDPTLNNPVGRVLGLSLRKKW